MNDKLFWIFGILQSVTLGTIVFLIFQSLHTIHGSHVIGLDTQIVLSVLFPLFLLLTELMIFKKNQ